MKRTRRIASFALSLLLAFPAVIIPSHADDGIQYSRDDLHELVSYTDAVEAGHVNRLNDEEDMNTLVFANSDNTKTMYFYADNIKYIDSDGEVRDKTNELTYKNGMYITRDNDIVSALPRDLTSGVTVSYEEIEIKMTPAFTGTGNIKDTASAAVYSATPKGEADTVTYNSVFGNNTSVRYTPTYSGLKEEIILPSYTGKHTFEFTVKTNGLVLMHGITESGETSMSETSMSDVGYWYFAYPDDIETPVAKFSDIVIYDSAGHMATGSLICNKVTDYEYTVTVSANKAFLESPNTVYPVTVDPTIEIKQGATAATFEDTMLSQQYSSTSFGSSTSLTVGNTQNSRIAFRTWGLNSNSLFNSLFAGEIKEATLTMKCLSKSSANFSIYIRGYDPIETESGIGWLPQSATYSRNGVKYFSSPSTSKTVTSTGTVEFNVTSLIKGLRDGSLTLKKGFLISASDSIYQTTGTEYYCTFASSEYNDVNSRPVLKIKFAASGIYKIKNVGNGLYMNVNSKDADANVYSAPNTDYIDQYVRLQYDSAQNAYVMYSMRSGYGTDNKIFASQSNINVVLSASTAYWAISSSSGNDYFRIYLKGTGSYITANSGSGSADGKSTSSTGNIYLSSYNTSNSGQIWDLERVDTYTLTVSAKNKNGNYIAGAELEVLTAGSPDRRQIVSLNTSGPTTLLMLNKVHGINVTAPGYAKQYYNPTITSGTTVNFTLTAKSEYPTLGWPKFVLAGGTTNVTSIPKNITSKYGYRCYSGTNNIPKVHKGVDISFSNIKNYNVYSISNGKVVSVGFVNGAGNTVVVKYDDYYIAYFHLESPSTLTVGTQVTKGVTIIGKVGGTQNSQNEDLDPHLHIEFYTGSKAWDSNRKNIDPRAFFENN